MPFEFLDLHIDGEKEQNIFNDIPFEVCRKAQKALPMPYFHNVDIDAEVEGLFFLGMTTEAASGECGWSGERYYAYQRKLYIGDIIGRIDILYEKNQVDAIPLIFGVNVWNYEAFSERKAHEGPALPTQQPYREPFESDREAMKLFNNSLLLFENDGDKYSKYIFALKTRKRKIISLSLKPYGGRDAGVGISAVTAFTQGMTIPHEEQWRFTDALFYLKKEYYSDMDKLARRLYQFLDEIPSRFPVEKPAEYKGPVIIFSGKPEAELLVNVYYHNICDMMYNKVEENGNLHTSTKDAPCFGFYNGIGTFRTSGHYNYYEQIWSRDIGRLLCELVEHGENERTRNAAEVLIKYLYDKCIIYKQPNWKRIVNASELGAFPENFDFLPMNEVAKGKENDGHASIMLFIYRLYWHGVVDKNWLQQRFQNLIDASEWFCWQIDNPEQSDFDNVLCSESESSYGDFGGYDMFSNSYAYYALLSFTELAQELGQTEYGIRWEKYARKLWEGIEKVFITSHPRYGRVISEPESDNWPSELKRMESLLIMPEMYGYVPSEAAPEMMDLWTNTYKAQKESFFSPMVGGSMGYGQGYTTQTALLLDQVEDYSQCLDWAARFCYHHTDFPYIVPEGITYHPSGRFWYRHTDLGNAVQQTEIIKCIRLVLGLDDLKPVEGLKLVPRIPEGWTRIETNGYPVAAITENGVSKVKVDFRYSRTPDGYELEFSSEDQIKLGYIRMGPFGFDTENVKLYGIEADIVLKRQGTGLFAYISVNRHINSIRIKLEK